MTVFDIIDKYLGIVYKDHGRNLTTGLDCWGLTLCICRDLFSLELPDLNYSKFSLLRHKDNIIKNYDMSSWVTLVENNYKLGDILLICTIKDLAIHTGVYLDKGKFIHADSKNGVVLGSIDYWKNQIEGYYRIKPELIHRVG